MPGRGSTSKLGFQNPPPLHKLSQQLNVIPCLLKVGKWVRILGFEVAEEDNSRQLAMNKAGRVVPGL